MRILLRGTALASLLLSTSAFPLTQHQPRAKTCLAEYRKSPGFVGFSGNNYGGGAGGGNYEAPMQGPGSKKWDRNRGDDSSTRRATDGYPQDKGNPYAQQEQSYDNRGDSREYDNRARGRQESPQGQNNGANYVAPMQGPGGAAERGSRGGKWEGTRRRRSSRGPYPDRQQDMGYGNPRNRGKYDDDRRTSGVSTQGYMEPLEGMEDYDRPRGDRYTGGRYNEYDRDGFRYENEYDNRREGDGRVGNRAAAPHVSYNGRGGGERPFEDPRNFDVPSDGYAYSNDREDEFYRNNNNNNDRNERQRSGYPRNDNFDLDAFDPLKDQPRRRRFGKDKRRGGERDPRYDRRRGGEFGREEGDYGFDVPPRGGYDMIDAEDPRRYARMEEEERRMADERRMNEERRRESEARMGRTEEEMRREFEVMREEDEVFARGPPPRGEGPPPGPPRGEGPPEGPRVPLGRRERYVRVAPDEPRYSERFDERHQMFPRRRKKARMTQAQRMRQQEDFMHGTRNTYFTPSEYGGN